MKVPFRITFIICALAVLVSGQMAFADKGKIIRSGRKALTGKTASNIAPKTSSSAARKGVSGAAVERAAAAAQRGALSTSAVRKKGNPQAGGGRKMPPASLAEKPNFNLPGLSADVGAADIGTDVSVADSSTDIGVVDSGTDIGVLDSGTNLTGVEVLQTYFPAWRQELSGMFSKAQLDAVERAIAATDEWIFVRDEDGELQIRNKDEWNYEARFFSFLKDSGISFTEKQINQLIGTRGTRGFTLRRYFAIENIHGFIIAHDGQSPRQSIKGPDGKSFKLSELRERARQGDEEAAELAAELEAGQDLGHALAWSKDLPERQIVEALYKASRNLAPPKTPQQVLAAYQQWTVDHPGTSPRMGITDGNGQLLTLTDLRARARQGDEQAKKLADELELGKSINTALQTWSKDSPEYKELKALYDANRNTKTPQQVLAAYKQWIAEHPGTSPRMGIRDGNGQLLTLTDLRARARQGDEEAARLAAELEVGQALNHALTKWSEDLPEYKELKALYDANRNQAAPKTPQQVLAAYRQWTVDYPGTSPRMNITDGNGQPLTLTDLRAQARQGDEQAEKLADELELGKDISNALQTWPQDSQAYKDLRVLYDANRNYAAKKPTEELYQDLVAQIRNYGHYPTRAESYLQQTLYDRLRRYQSTMVDGKYVDPYLQKIYEIKLWSERVKRGEVDWTQFPGLFKKHRRTIGEMQREAQQPSTEAVKELEALPAEEQQAIEQMADNMLTLWENFEEKWWQENQKHIITTPNTRVAFDTVLNAVRHQVPGANNVNISNVLEQVSGMQLGQDGPEYYGVIYRGNNPRIPRAEDFHNVQEIPGLPQRFAEPAYKLDKPHIFLDGDEDVVLNMFLNPGVTDREMNAVIAALTPAGWEVRIGAHELLRDIKKGQMHIHIEKIVPTTEEGAQDISYVLNVKLRQLTQGQNPQQVAKTLRYLFSSYLTEEGQWALNNIQKAF